MGFITILHHHLRENSVQISKHRTSRKSKLSFENSPNWRICLFYITRCIQQENPQQKSCRHVFFVLNRPCWRLTLHHQEFRWYQKNAGILNLISGYLGGGFSRIHKPYLHYVIQLIIGEDSSILGTLQRFLSRGSNHFGCKQVGFSWPLLGNPTRRFCRLNGGVPTVLTFNDSTHGNGEDMRFSRDR